MNKSDPSDIKKRRLFTLLMLCTPVILLVLLELLLRLFQYGGDQHLFVTGPEKQISHYWMCNQDVGRRYFYMLDSTPSPPKDLFLKAKPENGYRIFVLGGSTTAGFPYSYNLMFSRILNFELSELFPDRHIEVVNTAMSAVNSYTLLDFMDEIIANEPDAILIYAGHNEYYGAMGIGSRESFGKKPAFIHLYLQLKKFKTFVLIRDAVGWLKREFSRGATSEIDPTNTLMARIVGEQEIPYKSDAYEQGLRQYERNMRRILEKAREHAIPVILSELVSNVKDQPPFISVDIDSFPTADKAFAIGQKLLRQGDVDDARTALTLAKDLDALRFRASEEMNEIIHQLGRQFNAPVVPMKTFFEAQCEDKIIGNELILEHLHPNARGYFIMADAFLQTMKENEFISASWDESRIRAPEEVMSSWGWTELDTVSANLSIHYLKGGWPFQPEIMPNRALENYHPDTHAESLAVRILVEKAFNLVAGHVAMAEHYELRHQYDKAFAEYRAAYYAIPHEIEFYEKAVRNLLRLNEMPEALAVLLLSQRYGRTAFTDRWAGLLLADAGRYREALPSLERAYSESPTDVQVLRYLSAALAAEGQVERARQVMAALDSTARPISEVDERELLYSVLLKSAGEILQKKEYTKALPLLQRAHDMKQTAFTAKWIGLIELKYGRIAEAAVLLQQAADLTPADFEVRYNLCNAYIALEQRENAERILSEMERLRPGFADPQNLRGRAALKSRK